MSTIQAIEVPVNEINNRQYFMVVNRAVYDRPKLTQLDWNICYGLYKTGEEADLFIKSQMNGYPKVDTKYDDAHTMEYKKFSITLPL